MKPFMEKSEVLTKSAIESKLSKVGDYVKIDFLRRCLDGSGGRALDIETRQFISFKLAETYEKIAMFGEAAKIIAKMSETSHSDGEQRERTLKAAELFVKGGIFDQAGALYRKAVALSKQDFEKRQVKTSEKEAYMKAAKENIARNRRSHAAKAYEQMLDITDGAEKGVVVKELMSLYEQMGKVNEYYSLKRAHQI